VLWLSIIECPGQWSAFLDEIMALLSDDEVQRIGIWGMGGVGKTTLVRSLNNKLKIISSMQPFRIIIWVTISQNFDIQKVQKQIAERLNLASIMGESMERLTNRLYEKLEKMEKFLLILDDIWEKIDLDYFGVPRLEDHKGSKIILTTRFFGHYKKQNIC
jgi:disease resistance protein RPS2